MKLKIDYRILVLMIFFIVVQKAWIYFILLGTCIIHELGHLLIGMLCGRKVEKIEILAIGCKMKFIPTYEDKKEIQEICIALAGPLTNLIMFALFLVIPFNIEYKEIYIYANILIGIFNLLPIYPLDGGRIFKNILKIYNDNTIVEEIVNNVSNVTMILLTMIASVLVIYYKNIIIFITVIYLWSILIKENKRYFFS